MKKWSLLLILMLGCSWVSFAQGPTTDPYPQEGGSLEGNVPIKRVSLDNGISYITKGGTLPYFVAPSVVTHGDWDMASGVVAPKTNANVDLTFRSKWAWEITPNSGITLTSAETSNNKNTLKAGDDIGEFTLSVVEKPQNNAFAGCANAGKEEITIKIVASPEFGFNSAEVSLGGETGTLIPKYDVQDAPALLQNKSVILIQSCDKANLENKELLLKYIIKEEDKDGSIPVDLQKYAYNVNEVGEFVVAQDGTGLSGAAIVSPAAISHPLTVKVSATNLEDKISFSTFTKVLGDNRSIDKVYVLQPANGATEGVVSSVSHRSFAFGADMKPISPIKGFAFTGASVVVIRWTKPPKTGPIYHIPNAAF